MNISKKIKKNKYIFYNGLSVVFLVILIFFFFSSGESGFNTSSPVTQAVAVLLVNIVIVFFSLKHFLSVENDYFSEGLKVGLIWFLLFLLADRLITVFLIGENIFYYFIPRFLIYLVFCINILGLSYILGKKIDKK